MRVADTPTMTTLAALFVLIAGLSIASSDLEITEWSLGWSGATVALMAASLSYRLGKRWAGPAPVKRPTAVAAASPEESLRQRLEELAMPQDEDSAA